jgi:hypothetical protein
LDGVVGIEGIRDPVFSIIIGMSCYVHFISYTLTRTCFCTVNLYRRRLSSCILSWVCDDVSLNVGSINCVVGDVASDIAEALAAGLTGALAAALAAGLTGYTTSSLFGHWIKGTLAATSLARTFQSTPGVDSCWGSTVSRTSFFDLSGGDTNIGLETSDRWRVFEVI